jgi:sec-independent protein translocase protein TatA
LGIESPVHLLFIAVVALIVLGPRRLPQLARALGKSVREFRAAIDMGEDEGSEESHLSSLPGGDTPAAGEVRAADEG